MIITLCLERWIIVTGLVRALPLSSLPFLVLLHLVAKKWKRRHTDACDFTVTEKKCDKSYLLD
jgi:hypothetical protein